MGRTGSGIDIRGSKVVVPAYVDCGPFIVDT
jgi:hypothetical protein